MLRLYRISVQPVDAQFADETQFRDADKKKRPLALLHEAVAAHTRCRQRDETLLFAQITCNEAPAPEDLRPQGTVMRAPITRGGAHLAVGSVRCGGSGLFSYRAQRRHL
jgi:hypothetical protein